MPAAGRDHYLVRWLFGKHRERRSPQLQGERPSVDAAIGAGSTLRAEPAEPEVLVPVGAAAHRSENASGSTPGDHVDGVLGSAEEAAVDVRPLRSLHSDAKGAGVRAKQRATETLDAAIDEAQLALREAERIRREADEYGIRTRVSAEAYADETRQRADAQARQKLAEAEDRAWGIRVEAERKAAKIENEAVLHQDGLVGDVRRSEERTERMLAMFRDMTAQLEALVRPESKAGKQTSAETPVDDALDSEAGGARGGQSRPAGRRA